MMDEMLLEQEVEKWIPGLPWGRETLVNVLPFYLYLVNLFHFDLHISMDLLL